MSAKSVDCPLRAMFQCTSMHVVVALISSSSEQQASSRTSRRDHAAQPEYVEGCAELGSDAWHFKGSSRL